MVLASKLQVERGGKPRVLGIDAELTPDGVTCASLHVEESIPLGPAVFLFYTDAEEAPREIVLDWFGLPAAPGKRTENRKGRVTLLFAGGNNDEENPENPGSP